MLFQYFAALFIVCSRQTTAASITISPPTVKPHNASGSVPATFPGYAFEEASFLDFTGNKSHPNKFSRNLIKAISDKTQASPIIRVGGTSLDHATFDPSLKKPIYNPDPNSGIPKDLKIGPTFFDVFSNFAGAKYVIDIPWWRNNLENSLKFAESAYKSIDLSNIYALEIGNEPDNYGNRQNWNEKQFSNQWGHWSKAISNRLNVSLDRPMFQAVALASQTGLTGTPGGDADSWKIGDIFQKGGMKQYRKRMKTVSMHYYQTKANETSDLQDDLMNHDKVVAGTEFIKQAIADLKKSDVNVPVVLGEVGNTLGNSSSGVNLEGVLGSALWQVDFSLYTMFLGVQGINMQSSTKFPFALWHPGTYKTPGVVLPAFYAHIFAAEFISSKKDVTVSNIDLRLSHLSAYAAYEGSKLIRLAIVNLDLWDGHDSNSPKRPHENITLQVPKGNDDVTIKRLTSKLGGTAKSSDQTTWGGMQWTYQKEGKGEKVTTGAESLKAENGTVSFSVDASEAVMVFF